MDPYYKDMMEHKEMFERYFALRDGDYGVPRRCYCGGRIVEEECEGKRFFTCYAYKNDGEHIRKNWVYAMEEEVKKLKKEIDDQSEMVQASASLQGQVQYMRLELKKNREDIEKMKGFIAKMKKLFESM